MKTPATDNTIAFLMASNNEDIAQDLANEITAYFVRCVEFIEANGWDAMTAEMIAEIHCEF